MRFLIYIFLLPLVVSACALPVPIGSELDSFVDKRELQTVSLAREGMALFNSSRYFEAEAKLRKALYLDPKLDNVRFNLATVLEKTGLFDEAETIYKDLIARNSDQPNYRAALGRLYMAQSKYALAREEFKKARELAEIEENEELSLSVSKSLVAVDFSAGELKKAICSAHELLNASRNRENFQRFIRLLLGAGEVEQARKYMNLHFVEFFGVDDPMGRQLKQHLDFAEGSFTTALENSEALLASSAVDPTYEFDAKTVNFIARYKLGFKNDFDNVNSISFLKILNDSLQRVSLSTMEWSPQLLLAAHDFISAPEVSEILSEDIS